MIAAAGLAAEAAEVTGPGGLTGGLEITLPLVLLVLGAGLVAGWLDAVVGGGGIVQLPVLMLIPGMTPVQALATNKVGSIAGTSASALTYLRRVRPDRSAALPAAGLAFAGAMLGAVLATVVPESLFRPVILVVVLGVGLFTLLKPSLGAEAALRYPAASKRHHAVAWALGFGVGVYDGVLGPGTGSFLVIGMVALLGFSFLQASANAKIINAATNLGALCFFVPAGHVVWPLGIAAAAGNVTGGWLGARTALRLGSGFVRVVFIVIAALLVLTLGWDMLSGVR